MSDPLIVASGVVKGYRTAAGYVPVLQGLDLTVPAGEMLAITGASGVGKSTLLHVLGTLDPPESGTITVAGEDVLRLSEERLRAFRNKTMGFVFQFHHLLPEFTALENVAMPGWIGRMQTQTAVKKAGDLLSELGLAPRAQHFPNQLSGGEQQRVAIARALLAEPLLFLADEPTGNLDQETSERVFDLMRDCHRKRGLSSVIVTHNPELAARCDRMYEMKARA